MSHIKRCDSVTKLIVNGDVEGRTRKPKKKYVNKIVTKI